MTVTMPSDFGGEVTLTAGNVSGTSDVYIGGGDGSVFLRNNVMVSAGGGSDDWDSITELVERQSQRIDDQQALIAQLTERLEAIEGYVDMPTRARLPTSDASGDSLMNILGGAAEVLRPDPHTMTMGQTLTYGPRQPPAPTGPTLTTPASELLTDDATIVRAHTEVRTVRTAWTQDRVMGADELEAAYNAAMAANLERTAIAE